MIGNLQDYFPTPLHLIEKMLAGIKLDEVSTILEPSAGEGHICEFLRRRAAHGYYSRRELDLDVIEIDGSRQSVLKGKGYRLVHDDFLTFNTHKAYQLIIANFPFSAGAEHLQKALSLLEKGGGRLRCLVNAETIRNPFTNLRQSVARTLERLGAEVEFLTDEFRDAERQTAVEVALIKLSIERKAGVSVILDSMNRAADEEEAQSEPQAVIDRDYRKAFVSRFNLEAAAGIRLIDEWLSLSPYILDRIRRPNDEGHDYSKPLIKLEVEGASTYGNSRVSYVNSYLRGLRHKYWELLVNHEEFHASFTSNILSDLNNKLKELRDYDFNLFNIRALEDELRGKIVAGVEESILKLFDSFSRKYAWDESLNEGNIHYYNGWKTNRAHKVNKKVIIPLHGYSAYSRSMDYRAVGELQDMVKVFNYLSDDKADVPQLVGGAVRSAEVRGRFTGMDMRYFTVDVYKKGTCHVKFTDERLLDKFNIFGSQRRGWLPPCYGKKSYDDMSHEEKAVIDSFQGEEKYREVMRQPDFYLVDTSRLLLGTSLDSEG